MRHPIWVWECPLASGGALQNLIMDTGDLQKGGSAAENI